MTDKWQTLTDILTCEQKDVIAESIIAMVGYGWGNVRIIIRDHGFRSLEKTEIEPFDRPAREG